MSSLEFSQKGQNLIDLYKKMATNGYDRRDGSRVEKAYNDFELKKFRNLVHPIFNEFRVASVLDYGSGGSDWDKEGFDQKSNKSATEFFNLETVARYEPARGFNQKVIQDCVVCMDVLEHIFVGDIPAVLRDIFRHAKKLVVLNVACYKAAALLENGENAHISVRRPLWWKGVLDTISLEFPAVSIMLICSKTYNSCEVYNFYKANDWWEDKKFAIDLSESNSYGKSIKNPPDGTHINLSQDQLFLLVSALIKSKPEVKKQFMDLISSEQ